MQATACTWGACLRCHARHTPCSIIIPKIASDPPEVDYEAELAVIIGRECKNVTESQAMSYVLGYT
ncbi:hypothetical protein EON66_07625, partial [archaeon]